MKIIHVYGGTMKSSYVQRIGGIEEHFMNLKEKVQSDFYVIYAAKPNDSNFEKIMKKSIIILSDNSYFSYMMEYIKFINKQKKNNNQLIVHVHFGPISHLVIVVTRLMGIKTIYWTKHSRLMIKKFSKSWFINTISTLFTRKLICVSYAIEEELKELNIGCQKMKIVPLGLNIDKFQETISLDTETLLLNELKIDSHSFVITIVADQRPEKRVEIFIEAFAEFVKKYNIENAIGLIVGGGPLELENIAFSKRLGVFHQLRFVGLRHDVNAIYKISDLAGLTSETEGFGFALAEAAAMSLPLFGSNVGAIPEIIKNDYNGFLFDVGDYKALSEIFYRFYIDENLGKQYGKNAFKHISENFEINACSNKLLQLYNTEFETKK